MRAEVMLLSFLVAAILLVGCAQQRQQPRNQTTTPTKADLCTQSGGIVKTQLCCGSAGDFPNTCLLGACSCSPDNSHEVKVCDCGEGKCWEDNENKCKNAQANNTQNQIIGMDQIYKFGSVHSYEYRVTSTPGGQTITTNFKATITSDTVNGTAAWLQQTDMTTQGVAITSKMWIDKATYKCLKTANVASYGEQVVEQPSHCPVGGPNSASRNETTTPIMTYIGIQSVTVPAGTFECDKYSYAGMSYWVTSSVPVPVKIASNLVTEELVSYT